MPLVGGLGACGAFIAYERRAPDPMLPLAIFRSRNFAVGNAVTFVVYAGLGAATFFIALFLQQVAGYSAFEAGLSLLPITLLLVTLARRFGALSARIGPRLPMAAGPLLCGAGLLAFARLDERADYLTGVLPASAAVRARARDHGRAADGDGAASGRPPPCRRRLGRQQRDRAGRGARRDRRGRRGRVGAVLGVRSTSASAARGWIPPRGRTSTRRASGR